MSAPGRPGTVPVHFQRVREEWIDYNGHLSEAYYVLVFGHATDALMDHVGLGSGYRARTGCSLYTVEAHVRYVREVARGAELAVRTSVLGVDAKKLRFTHEMYVVDPAAAEAGGPGAADTRREPWLHGPPVATEELLALHVDQHTQRTAAFPEEVAERLAVLVGRPPEWAGRGIVAVGGSLS